MNLHWIKLTNGREGKQEQKIVAAFGTIFRISKFSKKQAETSYLFFSLTRQAKNLITTSPCTERGGGWFTPIPFHYIYHHVQRFYVGYSTLLHLPPLRFHCVGGSNPKLQCTLQLRGQIHTPPISSLSLCTLRLDV
jgi:hypothetical protein